jgi:hypothetical protein
MWVWSSAGVRIFVVVMVVRIVEVNSDLCGLSYTDIRLRSRDPTTVTPIKIGVKRTRCTSE